MAAATSEELQRALDKAVVNLFHYKAYAAAFLTTIYCSLKFSWDETIPTACTNGLFLKINPDWFMSLSEKMRITLISHELWHIAYMHMARCGNRIWQIFNMAADYAINIMLKDHGYNFDLLPNGQYLGLVDDKYRGMTTEQIYDELIKNAVTIELPFGSDISNENEKEEELTEQELAEVVAVVVRASTVSDMVGGGAGTLPGEVSVMMDALLRPRLKWQTLLNRWLTERSEEGYTWARPNRRYEDIYLPSKNGEEGLARLLYAADDSGSMTDKQILVVNSEFAGVKEIFNCSMLVVSFDDVIQDVWEFSPEDNLTSLEFHGRGGTNMFPVFEMAVKEGVQAIIMMSDMDCVIPPKPKGIEVLWLCLDNPRWKAPYGQAIHIDSRRDL